MLDLRRGDVDFDDHDIELSELFSRYSTDIRGGLTSDQVFENRQKFGVNKLTPPPATSEMVRT